jgi:predicted nucleotidyltransferase
VTAKVNSPELIVEQIAEQFARQPQVTAVALAGSRAATTPDERSDIDLYVYSREQVPVMMRRELALIFSDNQQIDNHFWEDGDEWITRDTGLAVDITFRSPQWIEDQLERLLVHHQASMGYSTCFWFNVSVAKPLFDREGWYARLQRKADQPYSGELQRAIIAKNHPVLRTLVHSSYIHQLDSAVARGDLVSIQHRSAALLASYFDILFAINKQLHPGEKRLVTYAGRLPLLPVQMIEDLNAFLLSACTPEQIMPITNRLLDRLDDLLKREGLEVH